MKTVFKSVVGVAICGLCACSVATDGTAEQEQSLGTQSSALEITGSTQGYRGDFNGDGNEDVIIQTESGSFLYTGLTGGGFNSGAWQRGDLSIGVASYTVGDFNGDGYSDLLITTSGGSFLYTGNASGNFSADVWTTTAWTLTNATIRSGDFNGDGNTDLVVSTSSGTEEYFGVHGTGSHGGFTAAWAFGSAFARSNVGFTVGDFNGDKRSDLIITSGSGAVEYLGLASGGFSALALSWGSNFPLNQSSFWAGDFNGDGAWDLIAQNDSGSYEYNGIKTAAGNFTNPPAWTRTDLGRLASTNFVPGDFNGDGKWDVVISTGSGAYLYVGRSLNQGITGEVWHAPSMTSSSTAFYAGNFQGAAKPTSLIVTNSGGSTEYLGQVGITTGGFTASPAFVRPDLPLGFVLYF